MSFRVCIPVAGTGSRLGKGTQYLNKSLLTVGQRPILSLIIDKFPAETEFVIALGFKGDLVRQFLELGYPTRRFHFVEVSPFEGPGSGLGLSLLRCREFLQEPFIFSSCDTLVSENVPPPEFNWMGFAYRDDVSPYRTLEVEDGFVSDIIEKGAGAAGERRAYIGLAGIRDFGAFWESMAAGGLEAIHSGEACGLRSVLHRGIQAKRFTWFDTGVPCALAETREAYASADDPHILEKANEAIWFLGDRVIKFSDDQAFIRNRVERGRMLAGFVPEIVGCTSNMYSYRKAAGRVVSDIASVPLLRRVLGRASEFWRGVELNSEERMAFKEACYKFYHDKTLERVSLFYKKTGYCDGQQPINGVEVPTLEALLAKVDWSRLAEGVPCRFHGDFHFENILWDQLSGSVTFLDWRQDFGGSLSVGDLYYDLAKLCHGLIVSHEVIQKNGFSVEWSEADLTFDLLRRQVLVDCEIAFREWLVENSFDVERVYELTALIFLNIAPLHHSPYDRMLYLLGKKMLSDFTK
jgi:hypothetical protein